MIRRLCNRLKSYSEDNIFEGLREFNQIYPKWTALVSILLLFELTALPVLIVLLLKKLLTDAFAFEEIFQAFHIVKNAPEKFNIYSYEGVFLFLVYLLAVILGTVLFFFTLMLIIFFISLTIGRLKKAGSEIGQKNC